MSYSPTLGRFLQTDPEEYADGLNLYQAYRGNPAGMVDPMGTTAAPPSAPAQHPVEEPNEINELRQYMDEYHASVGAVRNAMVSVLRECGQNDPEATSLLQTVKNALVNGNTAITAGLSALTAERFLSMRPVLMPWVTDKLKVIGNRLTVVGIIIESVNFGQAVGAGDTDEAVSSGGVIVGSAWGLWNPYAAVATGLGALGKEGIKYYYRRQGEQINEQSLGSCCEKYKQLLRSALEREAELRAGVESAMGRLVELGASYER